LTDIKKTVYDKLTVAVKKTRTNKNKVSKIKKKTKNQQFLVADKPRCIKVKSTALSTQSGYFMPTCYNELQILFSVT